MKIFLSFLLTVLVSTNALKAETGILILAHGSMRMSPGGMCNNNNPSKWEKAVLDATDEVRLELPYKTQVAFGMWSTMCIEAGIMRLKMELKKEGKTLDHLKVLPLFISSDSAVIEMQKYIFKKRADKVIPVPSVKPTKFSGKISYLEAMDYHPKIALILASRLFNLIEKAKEEGLTQKDLEVVLVMHGPVGDEDNKKWLEFARLYMKDIMSDLLPNNESFIISLRDDASDEVRDQATQNLRYVVSNARRSNKKSLILPLLLSSGGIEKGILERLTGLDYIWTGEMLLPDSLLGAFILDRLK